MLTIVLNYVIICTHTHSLFPNAIIKTSIVNIDHYYESEKRKIK